MAAKKSRKVQLNYCAGDHELQMKWIEEHRSASLILYNEDQCLPVMAVYFNPIYQACVKDPADFWAAVRAAERRKGKF